MIPSPAQVLEEIAAPDRCWPEGWACPRCGHERIQDCACLQHQIEAWAKAQGAPSGPAIASDAPITTANPKDAVGSSKAPMSTVSAAVMAEVGVAMFEGALKYGRHNYRIAPIRASVYFDAAHRHLRSWWDEGQDIDPASGLHHVTKAIATLTVLRDSMITGKWDDDRPPPVPPGFLDDLDAKAAELVAKYPEPKRAVRAGDK